MKRRLLFASAFVAACSTFSSSGETTSQPDGGLATGDAATDAANVDAGAESEGPPPCPNASCGEVIASGQANAAEVLVDEKRVYWTIESDTGTVMARGHEAGTVPYAVIVNGVKPRSVVRFSELLHFASGGQVRNIERSQVGGGSSLTAVATGNPVTSVIRKGAFVFATVGPLVQWCQTSNNNCPAAGTAFSFQHDVGVGARALAADSSDTRLWLATDVSVWKSEVTSPSWTEWWPISKVQAIAADQTSVFVARRGEGGLLKFQRDDPKTAPGTPLVPMAPPPWAMVLDGAFIFYTAIEQGVVVKVAKDGSLLKVLASGLQSPNGIAVRLDKVYVALGDGRIVALPHQ